MNWPVLWAKLKALEGKVDSLELITLEKVETLPEVGERNVIYLVPKEVPGEGNYSDEYIWDSDEETYEQIGDTQVAPIEDYIKDSSIAPLYDNTSTYAVGDIVVYENELYRCTTAISTAEEWDSIHWTKTDIISEMPVIPPIPADANHNIASAYDSTATYDLGDLCIYNGNLYECSTAISTAEEWTAAHWTAKTVADELANKANNSDIPTDYAKDTSVTALYDSTATYELGDIVMYQKELYECTTAIPVAEEWDSTHWTKTDIFSQMPSGGGALSALSDVDLTNPSDNQDLVYSTTLGKWINKTKTVTLTKAQYDLLPSSKLTDGIMYYITDLDINDYAKDSSIADLYDNTSTYAVDDIVMFENELYKCTTAVSVAEDFDVTKWTSITVMDIISASITSVLNTSF